MWAEQVAASLAGDESMLLHRHTSSGPCLFVLLGRLATICQYMQYLLQLGFSRPLGWTGMQAWVGCIGKRACSMEPASTHSQLSMRDGTTLLRQRVLLRASKLDKAHSSDSRCSMITSTALYNFLMVCVYLLVEDDLCQGRRHLLRQRGQPGTIRGVISKLHCYSNDTILGRVKVTCSFKATSAKWDATS